MRFAAPLSCGAGHSRAPLLARLPGNNGPTTGRRSARALRREQIIHASAPRVRRRCTPRPPYPPRWLPARLEHVLIHPWTTGLCCSPAIAESPPAAAATLADNHGFQTFYVPEHTHIPVKRQAAHPTTGDESLPDDRYMRTLDPWVSLGAACAVTSRVRLSTAVALPVEHDPITLAKSIATLDHLSGGRVSLGVGFGWNTDELADHGVPPGRRRTMLREYIGGDAGAVDPRRGLLRGRVRQLRAELGVAQAGAVAHPGSGRGGRQREELQVDCPAAPTAGSRPPETSTSTSR